MSDQNNNSYQYKDYDPNPGNANTPPQRQQNQPQWSQTSPQGQAQWAQQQKPAPSGTVLMKRLLITLIIMTVSLICWFFGTGIHSESLAETGAENYEQLTENKADYTEYMDSLDSSLPSEEIYNRLVKFYNSEKDGTMTIVELTQMMSTFKKLYQYDVDLSSISLSSSSVSTDNIRVVNGVYLFLIILIILTIASFAVSILLMTVGKKKHAPVFYMILSIINFVLMGLFVIAINDSTNPTSLTPLSFVSLAAGIAAVVFWSIETKKIKRPQTVS